MKELTIGQVAAAANVNTETVKYYEKRELIPIPARSDAGYRLYPVSTVEQLRLIKKAQGIGFTLNEIKQLLTLVQQEDHVPLEEMQAFAISKIKEIDDKISKLNSFKTLLQQAVERHGGSGSFSRADCPVLQKLEEG